MFRASAAGLQELRPLTGAKHRPISSLTIAGKAVTLANYHANGHHSGLLRRATSPNRAGAMGGRANRELAALPSHVRRKSYRPKSTVCCSYQAQRGARSSMVESPVKFVRKSLSYGRNWLEQTDVGRLK